MIVSPVTARRACSPAICTTAGTATLLRPMATKAPNSTQPIQNVSGPLHTAISSEASRAEQRPHGHHVARTVTV